MPSVTVTPDAPLANTTTMSHTDVSPSTETRLNVYFTAFWSIFLREADSMPQSVVKTQIIVARLGWIMPEPLAMPEMQTVLPSVSSICADTSFGTVSVVIMAYSALCAVSSAAERPFTRSGITGSILSRGSLEPITPVDAVRISEESQPMMDAAQSAIFEASSTPTAPTPALATLLLTMMPRALPLFSIMSMDLVSE